uniref:Uncharacterized protein n=1 Tax=Chromera velia CCMP2878 TaxID=1169474 RepID=A0A0G4IF11_9ALVE|eukprot:Cvel_13743.t1-p1 / transcript=Cvel_13743.t1 / gene=Cvel_13743 / organism=Chromera_velia_CCMP2878 / gene_product=hypothetical protein / transcript_product=hypothetical protein / location=Cvel_scaffold951:28112-31590(+) / protein_length=888 / sequence_SO=supercontig / SO=protein_coding / is_pseudo=false
MRNCHVLLGPLPRRRVAVSLLDEPLVHSSAVPTAPAGSSMQSTAAARTEEVDRDQMFAFQDMEMYLKAESSLSHGRRSLEKRRPKQKILFETDTGLRMAAEYALTLPFKKKRWEMLARCAKYRLPLFTKLKEIVLLFRVFVKLDYQDEELYLLFVKALTFHHERLNFRDITFASAILNDILFKTKSIPLNEPVHTLLKKFDDRASATADGATLRDVASLALPVSERGHLASHRLMLLLRDAAQRLLREASERAQRRGVAIEAGEAAFGGVGKFEPRDAASLLEAFRRVSLLTDEFLGAVWTFCVQFFDVALLSDLDVRSFAAAASAILGVQSAEDAPFAREVLETMEEVLMYRFKSLSLHDRLAAAAIISGIESPKAVGPAGGTSAVDPLTMSGVTRRRPLSASVLLTIAENLSMRPSFDRPRGTERKRDREKEKERHCAARLSRLFAAHESSLPRLCEAIAACVAEEASLMGPSEALTSSRALVCLRERLESLPRERSVEDATSDAERARRVVWEASGALVRRLVELQVEGLQTGSRRRERLGVVRHGSGSQRRNLRLGWGVVEREESTSVGEGDQERVGGLQRIGVVRRRPWLLFSFAECVRDLGWPEAAVSMLKDVHTRLPDASVLSVGGGISSVSFDQAVEALSSLARLRGNLEGFDVGLEMSITLRATWIGSAALLGCASEGSSGERVGGVHLDVAPDLAVRFALPAESLGIGGDLPVAMSMSLEESVRGQIEGLPNNSLFSILMVCRAAGGRRFSSWRREAEAEVAWRLLRSLRCCVEAEGVPPELLPVCLEDSPDWSSEGFRILRGCLPNPCQMENPLEAEEGLSRLFAILQGRHERGVWLSERKEDEVVGFVLLFIALRSFFIPEIEPSSGIFGSNLRKT